MTIPHIIRVDALTPTQIQAMAAETYAREHDLGWASCPFDDGTQARKVWLIEFRRLAGATREAA